MIEDTDKLNTFRLRLLQFNVETCKPEVKFEAYLPMQIDGSIEFEVPSTVATTSYVVMAVKPAWALDDSIMGAWPMLPGDTIRMRSAWMG